MKHYILLSLLAVAFLSCKKKDNLGPPPPSITGNWEKTNEGGFSAYYTPPKHLILKLTGNTYERYVEGVLVKSGTYRVAKDRYEDNSIGNRIVFDNDMAANKSFYGFNADNELFIFMDPYLPHPGGVVFYKKIN